MPVKLSSLDLVAEALGVTRYRVSKWKKQGCPALQQSPYDIEKIKRWIADAKSGEAARHESSSQTTSANDHSESGRTRPDSIWIRSLYWLKGRFLGGLTVGVLLTIVGLFINRHFSLESQKRETQHALSEVLEKLSNTVGKPDQIVVSADAFANVFQTGTAEAWSRANRPPGETLSDAGVNGQGKAGASGHVKEGSLELASFDTELDLRPSAPNRSALVSLDVAFHYEKARLLERELKELGVESLSYIEYIMLAFGAAQIGRFDEAVEYLNKAEQVAEGIPKVLVLGIHGHFLYSHSRDSTDRELAGKYYSEAIKHLDRHPSRLGNRLRADLSAAWALDAIEAGAIDVGLERADEALGFYESVPAARSQMVKFAKKLQALKRVLPIKFLEYLNQFIGEEERPAKQSAPGAHLKPSAPSVQQPTLSEQVLTIICRHWIGLWKDLRILAKENNSNTSPDSSNRSS